LTLFLSHKKEVIELFKSDELCISISDIVRCICIEHLSEDEHVYMHFNTKTFLQYMIDNDYLDDSYLISLDTITEYCNNIKIV
jgi:hypothetical protein